ncbi:tRNA pseudouridine(55) synthase TruB [Methyloversatilis sp. RAC08]|uniref:tRNA pseudouridine(55) synthase TruB n=1 Tax=Methyloversatilis sp. RAC08 TaxID=1842540 RepID=UPI00083CE5E8|nr:tRNA pseudouridine(55) synthase TruB [Methyloversatilis sp. RAC08]
MQPRSRWKAVHGVLLLDKPIGLSSNDALQKARRLFQAARAGHTGTLDPLASGLLPVCFGDATRFAGLMLDADKEYLAQVRLGVRTSTGDAEGDILDTRPVDVSLERLLGALAAHRGDIEQIPPMHSALKHQGKALYEYARAGETIERAVRHVRIHEIELLDCALPAFSMRVRCSKGTYIRTLAEDIGEMLGCGAHLSGLRRTLTGPLSLDCSHTLETLSALDEAQRMALLLPPDCLLQDLPACQLDGESARRLIQGQIVPLEAFPDGATMVDGQVTRAYDGTVFLGLVSACAGRLQVKRLLPQESGQKA